MVAPSLLVIGYLTHVGNGWCQLRKWYASIWDCMDSPNQVQSCGLVHSGDVLNVAGDRCIDCEPFWCWNCNLMETLILSAFTPHIQLDWVFLCHQYRVLSTVDLGEGHCWIGGMCIFQVLFSFHRSPLLIRGLLQEISWSRTVLSSRAFSSQMVSILVLQFAELGLTGNDGPLKLIECVWRGDHSVTGEELIMR